MYKINVTPYFMFDCGLVLNVNDCKPFGLVEGVFLG